MGCRLLLVTALTCTSLDQIHGCDINLEPDYQRGEFGATMRATLPDAFQFRRRMARSKANRHNRLYLSELLYSASNFWCIVLVLLDIAHVSPAAVLMHEDGSETRTCIDGKQD